MTIIIVMLENDIYAHNTHQSLNSIFRTALHTQCNSG
jgi:hypothetical protein